MRDWVVRAILEFGGCITDEWEPDREWSQDELISSALHQLQLRDEIDPLPEPRLVTLRAALHELVASNFSDAELGAIWVDTGARLSWSGPGAMRRFLARALDAISKSTERAPNGRRRSSSPS